MTDQLIQRPEVLTFYDPATNTFSHIVIDPDSSSCMVLDPVLDLDYASGEISYSNADELVECIRKRGLKLEMIIETHVHADHLSAAPYLQAVLGGKIGIGSKISLVQDAFGKVFNAGTKFERDGSQFDVLFDDGDEYLVGGLIGKALHTPGHTPACMTHVIGDCAFVGDTIFMPDSGTARADFPGGDAGELFESIQRILSLPDETKLYMCHDYQPGGREVEYMTTVAEEKAKNIHVKQGTDARDFIAMREARDDSLGMPKLILPSLQVNMRAGHFPNPEDNNDVYLKVPIKGLKRTLIS